MVRTWEEEQAEQEGWGYTEYDCAQQCEDEGHQYYGDDYLDGVTLVGRCWCGKAIYPR